MRKPYTNQDIEELYSLNSQRLDIEEIAERMNRSVASIKNKIREDGIERSMPENQVEIENDLSEAIFDKWESCDQRVEMKTCPQGYTRSNMVNGLPKNVESAKKYWEQFGRDNFRKVTKHRRESINKRNSSMKTGSIKPLDNWLGDYRKDGYI